jgi:hypothetical protein
MNNLYSPFAALSGILISTMKVFGDDAWTEPLVLNWVLNPA